MLYADEFLVERFILANAYREHGELNFEAKIFFHEPLNKFYDLPMIKKIAWEQLNKLRAVQTPLDDRRSLQNKEKENFLKLIDLYYKDNKNSLKQDSVNFEKLIQSAMIISGPKLSEDYKQSVHQHDDIIDSFVRELIN